MSLEDRIPWGIGVATDEAMKSRINIILKQAGDLWRNPRSGSALLALFVLFVLVLVWAQASRWYQARLLAEVRSEAAMDLSLRSNALSAAINRRLTLVTGLHAFVQSEASDPEFASKFKAFASSLYASTPGIRNIALAPQGVMQFVYPVTGNEMVLGYDPLKDPRPEIRAAVEHAIATREITLSGPTDLLQGGVGLIARQAVFIGDQYWGLVNIVLDWPTILERAELVGPTGELRFALQDNSQDIFFGDPQLASLAPVASRLGLPEGEWQLLGAPAGGWEAAVQREMLVFQIAGLIIACLLSGVVYLSSNRQASLARAVRLRTREITRMNEQLHRDFTERLRAEQALREQEIQYREIFESLSDGVFINNLDGVLIDFNPAAAQMHGYTPEEFHRLQPAQFIHPDYQNFYQEYIETVKTGETYHCHAIDVRKDGSTFDIEVYGSPFLYRGQEYALAVVRDVSEQMRTMRTLERMVQERTHELSTLLRVSHTVASTLELEPLLGLIMDALKDVVDYDRVGTFILEGEDRAVLLDYRGEQLSSALPVYDLGEAYFTREMLHDQKPFVLPDTTVDTQLALDFRAVTFWMEYPNRSALASAMAVPLVVKEKSIGFLHLEHPRPNFYTQHHADLALAFAQQAAAAIENARLYQQAQNLAALQERQKLARELHDSVSQALYGMAMGARTARTLLDRRSMEHDSRLALAEPLDYVLSLADAGLAEMRALIFELRPESLENEGLVAALSKQIAALRARHNLAVEVLAFEEPSAPLEVKEHLYRIAQEALHNIIKHAQAKKVTLALTEHLGVLTLEICDDGLGFEANGSFPGHFGLRTMRERAERLNGSFEVSSAPGEGTRIRVQIPLTPLN